MEHMSHLWLSLSHQCSDRSPEREEYHCSRDMTTAILKANGIKILARMAVLYAGDVHALLCGCILTCKTHSVFPSLTGARSKSFHNLFSCITQETCKQESIKRSKLKVWSSQGCTCVLLHYFVIQVQGSWTTGTDVSSLIELKVISVQTAHPIEKNIIVAETWRLPFSKQMEKLLARMAVLYAGSRFR